MPKICFLPCWLWHREHLLWPNPYSLYLTLLSMTHFYCDTAKTLANYSWPWRGAVDSWNVLRKNSVYTHLIDVLSFSTILPKWEMSEYINCIITILLMNGFTHAKLSWMIKLLLQCAIPHFVHVNAGCMWWVCVHFYRYNLSACICNAGPNIDIDTD